MKTIILLLSLLSTSGAWAQACPQISGDYLSSEGLPVRYLQDGCKSITRLSAPDFVYGKLIFRVKRTFELGGAAFCVSSNVCEKAEVVADAVKFSFNFNARRRTPEHGLCTNRETSVSPGADGKLTYKLAVVDCDDGFQGEIVQTWNPSKAAK